MIALAKNTSIFCHCIVYLVACSVGEFVDVSPQSQHQQQEPDDISRASHLLDEIKEKRQQLQEAQVVQRDILGQLQELNQALEQNRQQLEEKKRKLQQHQDAEKKIKNPSDNALSD